MTEKKREARVTGRREFLSQLSGAAAASGLVFGGASRSGGAEPTKVSPLPTISLGSHRITRLVAGSNPISGYSYMGPNMNRQMLEYFTPERTVEFLERCEREGINAHQFSHTEKMAPIFRTLREHGSKMKFICLHSAGSGRLPLKDVIEQTGPIAIVHHGGATDKLFREGKSQQVHDFVKSVRDAGVLAGVSAHNPDCIKRVADEGWEVDLFMNCFYYITRQPEEIEKLPPVVTVQIYSPFFETDPATMTEVVRQVKQPCLGFKILAAGRKCYKEKTVKEAFQFAFEHIKPTDGVIVGMYPQYHDEVRANAQYTRQFGSTGKT